MKVFYDKAILFLKEAYAELRKVSWLSQKEVIGSTTVIIIFIFAVAIYVGFVDFLLSRVLNLLLQR